MIGFPMTRAKLGLQGERGRLGLVGIALGLIVQVTACFSVNRTVSTMASVTVPAHSDMGLLHKGTFDLTATIERRAPSALELAAARAYLAEIDALVLAALGKDPISRGASADRHAEEADRHPSILSAQAPVESQQRRESYKYDAPNFSYRGSIKVASRYSAPVQGILFDKTFYQYSFSRQGESSPLESTVWVQSVEDPKEYLPGLLFVVQTHVRRANVMRDFIEEVGLAELKQGATGESLWEADFGASDARWAGLMKRLDEAGVLPGNGAFQSAARMNCRLDFQGGKAIWSEEWFDVFGGLMSSIKIEWIQGHFSRMERDWFLIGSALAYSHTVLDLHRFSPIVGDILADWEPEAVDKIYDER